MRSAGTLAAILTALLYCLLMPCASGTQIKEASPVEVEDRDLIHHLLKDKYYVYAREEAEEYLEKYPKGIFRAEVLYVLAEVAVLDKSLEKALSYYDAVLNRHPDSDLIEDSLYYSGILHLKLDQNRKGREKLRLLIKKYPQSRFLFRTYFKLGELAFKDNNWKTAEVYLEATVKNGDLQPAQQLEAENYLAWTYYFQNKKNAANQLFQPLLQSDLSNSHKTRIAYQLAIDAQKESNYTVAIAWHERVLNEWPLPDFTNKSRFWIAESLFLMHQNSENQISDEDKKKAVRLYSQNLKLTDPVEPENSHYHRGWFLLDLGRADEAEKDFNWLQSRNEKYGKNVELTIIRARYHESRNDLHTANQIYKNALNLQDDANSKNRLLVGIIRNDYQQKNCRPVIQEFEKIRLPEGIHPDDDIMYFAGSCYYQEKQIRKAENAFEKIEISSPYAVLSFDFYMDSLRRNQRQAKALEYLEKASNEKQFQDREKILLYQTEFMLDLELWFGALKAMKELVGISADKKKDPWFLLNVARTLDQVVIAMNSEQWRLQRPELQSVDYYKKQAIIYYREAYKYMPIEREAVRLSILEILIRHHESKKAWKTLSYQYKTAINLSRDERQKDRFAYRLAGIRIKLGQDNSKVIPLLQSIHGRADREVNYKASSLLAELYIGKKNFQAAIETLIDLAQQPIDKTSWYPKVHFRLGELYQAQEQWLPAIQHYSKVAETKQAGGKQKEAQDRMIRIKKFVRQRKAAERKEQEKEK